MEKKKILVVDDEEALVRLIQLNLEETGRYQVRTETRGVQALASAVAFQPDLILLDIVMPDKDGVELAREIQADASFQHTPIMFLTAAALKEARENMHEGNIAGFPFIEKPVSLNKLVDSIEQITRPKQPGKI